ncbi:hypothetical protein [Campylobacter sp. 19-13652]|uniref:hypothetical protein n=1 Tax=Campylobacter sp. 19-13652 TaxID=2840180 RepID=UPI001C77E6F5|nr:hypothetical protein [Campylobacter sp. 19-13652]BCX79240.1 hypothetical protein LBC_07020 [Campylobacter sp. 19-13652]
MNELEQTLRQKFEEIAVGFFGKKGKEPDWRQVAFETFSAFAEVYAENKRLITTIETIKTKG